MSVLYLIRHGQASFGAANYDQLSGRGVEQSRLLGAWIKRWGITFHHVVAGGSQRHLQTAEAFFDAYGKGAEGLPRIHRDPDFNEVEFEAMLRTSEAAQRSPGTAAKGTAGQTFADFQMRINNGYIRWTNGLHDHEYEESWPAFNQRCVDALMRAIALARPDENVVAFTSGGTITAICKHVLGFSAEQMAVMMWCIFNSSITRLDWDQNRFALTLFNSTAHLDQTGDASLITLS